MEWSAADFVATLDQRGIGIEKFSQARGVVRLGGEVDGVVVERSGASSQIAGLLEGAGDFFVTAFARHFDEAAIVVAVPFGIGAGVQKKADGFEVAGACGEMDRLLAHVGSTGEFGIAIEKLPESGRVAGGGGGDHRPDVIGKVVGLCHR
jgi:hypothetical protein